MRSVNYKEKDYDQIFKEMLQDAYSLGLLSNDEHFLDYINNRQDIENMYVLFLSVYAFENDKVYEDMTRLYNSNNLEKAVGIDLDIIGAKLGVPRPQARKSSVPLTFTAPTVQTTDKEIPKGTVVSNEKGNITYYTIEKGVIIKGQTSTTVQAYSTNTGYNNYVARHGLTRIVSGVQGVSVTNNKGTAGGRSAYNDDEYRELLRNWAYSHIKGTKEAYELFFSYYDGIDSYRLVPLWDGAGTVKVIVDPSDDWILNDISNKLLQNVELFDDDVFVTGAIQRQINVDAVANVTIDNVIEYSDEEKQLLAQRITNAIKLYIDGGYRSNGRYYSGLSIGNDFVPFLAGIFVKEEVPQIKSIDFSDTIKSIDNVVYADEFSPIFNKKGIELPSPRFDATNNRLIGSYEDKCSSDILYISKPYKIISDNDGFRIDLMMGDEVLFSSEKPAFNLEDIDLYGATIRLTGIKDGATISEIMIYEYDSDNDGKNTHININDDEIAVCGTVNVTIQ